jgi:zinc protease
MKQSNYKSLLSAAMVAILVAGCASGAGSGAGSNASGGYTKPSSSSVLRPHREITLTNGLKVLFVPDQSLPSLSMGLLVKSGASEDPEGMAGLTNLVASLLDQGTRKRNALQIGDDLGRIGASFRASVDHDYSYMSISGLSTKSADLFSNFFEITTMPSFADAELARVKKQIVGGIERAFDNPRYIADLAATKALFGKHPYGRSVAGTSKEVAALSKKSVIQHYLRYFRPNNSVLVVVGQFDADFESKVETEFGTWAKREVEQEAVPVNKAPEGIRIVVVDKPGLTQAQIRFVTMGIRRNNDDFLALRVGNTVFGGAFASRLNDRIRKELGLTYSISSGFDARLSEGPFEIETFTKIDSIEKVVVETLAMYKKLLADGITSEEIKRVRGYLTGVFPQAIETSDKLAFNMLLLRLYGIPDTYLTNYVRDLSGVSVSDVNAALRKALNPRNLTVVIHAPAASAESLKGKFDSYEVIPVSSLQ